MKRVRRLDFQRIGSVTRTSAGGVRIRGAVTRAGCFEYKTSDGKTIVEYRPTSEVFAPASMQSLNSATVTIGHPPDMVTPSNYREVVRGHIVAGSPTRDKDHLVAEHAIDDAECIRRIDSGELVEESCGYRCDLEEKPGVVPDGEPDAGKKYDRIQRNIEYNHVALGKEGWGRGGSSVSLRLDSNGDVCLNANVENKRVTRKASRTMKLPKVEIISKREFRIDGITYNVKTAAGRAQAKAVIDATKARIREEIATLRKDDAESEENDALKSISDTLMSMVQQIHDMMARNGVEATTTPDVPAGEVSTDDAIDEPQDDPDETKDSDDEAKPDTMDSKVEERAAIIEKARKIDSKISTRGKSNISIMRSALKSARVDGVDDFNNSEVRGAFAVLPVRTTHPSLQNLGNASSPRNRTQTRGDSHDGNGEAEERVDGFAAQASHRKSWADAWKQKR